MLCHPFRHIDDLVYVENVGADGIRCQSFLRLTLCVVLTTSIQTLIIWSSPIRMSAILKMILRRSLRRNAMRRILPLAVVKSVKNILMLSVRGQ